QSLCTSRGRHFSPTRRSSDLDIISEVYGFKASRRVIYATFLIAVVVSLTYWIIIALPPAEFYDGQEALTRTLGPVPLIVLASLVDRQSTRLNSSHLSRSHPD